MLGDLEDKMRLWTKHCVETPLLTTLTPAKPRPSHPGLLVRSTKAAADNGARARVPLHLSSAALQNNAGRLGKMFTTISHHNLPSYARPRGLAKVQGARVVCFRVRGVEMRPYQRRHETEHQPQHPPANVTGLGPNVRA